MQNNMSIYLELCLCAPDECRSNINSVFTGEKYLIWFCVAAIRNSYIFLLSTNNSNYDVGIIYICFC